MITITHTTITPCKPLQAIYRRVGVNSLSCSLCIHCPVWGKDGLPQGPYLWCPVNIAVDKINGCWSAYFPHMRGNQGKERGERFARRSGLYRVKIKSNQMQSLPHLSGLTLSGRVLLARCLTAPSQGLCNEGISYNPCTYPGEFLRYIPVKNFHTCVFIQSCFPVLQLLHPRYTASNYWRFLTT